VIDLQTLPVVDLQLYHWDDAYRLWLDGQSSPNTRRAYAFAVQGCILFCQAKPWEIGRTGVAEWVQDMRECGLADTTVNLRLAAVSSFFRFVTEEYTQVDADGIERPLHSFNPAAGKRLRNKITPYGKAGYLTADQARQLLKAIDRDTLHGLQDYALFTGYLFTARRNTEWRTAHTDRFVQLGARVRYRYDGKGKQDSIVDIAPPVWDAVQTYQKAAEIPGYLFTALSNRALNLPTVTQENWNKGQPISAYEVGRRLKRYASLAGLRTDNLKVHTLRHTASMLRRAAGDDVEKISKFMDHSSLAITQIYLQAIEGQQDTSWSKIADLLL
jgi:site-specific recombinase XerD